MLPRRSHFSGHYLPPHFLSPYNPLRPMFPPLIPHPPRPRMFNINVPRTPPPLSHPPMIPQPIFPPHIFPPHISRPHFLIRHSCLPQRNLGPHFPSGPFHHSNNIFNHNNKKNGNKGFDKNFLDSLEINKIKDVNKLDDDKKKCTICLEEYVNGDESIILPCIHLFHANCIKTWMENNKTCPLCNSEIKYQME